MDSADKPKILEMWQKFGQEMLDKPDVTQRITSERFAEALKRFETSMRGLGVAIGIPAKRDCMEETLACAMDLCSRFGLIAKSVHSFEIANNRQYLLDHAIAAGADRLLFLDTDTVIDGSGFLQMMETMDRTGAAMISALVKMRASGEYNAWYEQEDGEFAQVRKETITTTGVAFPVKWCGLAAALLDLDQIKKHPGPQFHRIVEGYKHVGEDRLFCQWLEKFELSALVDPKVQTIHVTEHYYGHGWKREDLEVHAPEEGK